MDILLAADIQHDSIVDGDGLRSVIWCQGCTHGCDGCHNPHTWDVTKGTLCDTKDIVGILVKVCWYRAVTFSGGEPFLQHDACCDIARELKKNNFSIWCYTGYVFEDICNHELLRYIDVLVDGRFVNGVKSHELHHKGSRNQRIIDVSKSLERREIFLKKSDSAR